MLGLGTVALFAAAREETALLSERETRSQEPPRELLLGIHERLAHAEEIRHAATRRRFRLHKARETFEEWITEAGRFLITHGEATEARRFLEDQRPDVKEPGRMVSVSLVQFDLARFDRHVERLREVFDRLSGERAAQVSAGGSSERWTASREDFETGRDLSYWRDQILTRGNVLVRNIEKTPEDSPAFAALREETRDFIGDMRGPAMGKFDARERLFPQDVERRLLRDGGAGDLRSVVETYLSIFERPSP